MENGEPPHQAAAPRSRVSGRASRYHVPSDCRPAEPEGICHFGRCNHAGRGEAERPAATAGLASGGPSVRGAGSPPNPPREPAARGTLPRCRWRGNSPPARREGLSLPCRGLAMAAPPGWPSELARWRWLIGSRRSRDAARLRRPVPSTSAMSFLGVSWAPPRRPRYPPCDTLHPPRSSACPAPCCMTTAPGMT